jgi:hypothetical protein
MVPNGVNTEQEEENFGSACDEWVFLCREVRVL